MKEQKEKWDEVENELSNIAAELTALGDMVFALSLQPEEMEDQTPKGIKLLITGVSKRAEDLRKYIGEKFNEQITKDN